MLNFMIGVVSGWIMGVLLTCILTIGSDHNDS